MTNANDTLYPQREAKAAQAGLSKREAFALRLAGNITSSTSASAISKRIQNAVKAADALIAELNKPVQ